jgi:hypothetical protein
VAVVATILLAVAVALGATVSPNRAASSRAGSMGATYVALGDSYSAGEGLDPFEKGTDVAKGSKRNQCHRSVDGAYPVLKPAVVVPQASSRAFFACSGATSKDIQSKPPTTGAGRQAGQPQQVATVGPRTLEISLSAGGNDVGFGDVALGCVEALISHTKVVRFSSTSCKDQIAASTKKLAKAKASLASLYTDLLNRAPHATIVVLGYPRVLPASYKGVPVLKGSAFCVLDHYPLPVVVDVGAPVADAKLLDAFTVSLNATVQDAIAAVRRAKPSQQAQLRYADSYASSVAHNCKGKTKNATVTAAQLTLGRGISGRALGDKLKKLWVGSSTLHPTKVGQKLFARLVQQAFATAPRDPLITTTRLPDGTVGANYTATLHTADNRNGTWTINAGALPAELALTSDGRITGTPTAPASTSFNVLFADPGGLTATASLAITITRTGAPAMTLETPALAFGLGRSASSRDGATFAGFVNDGVGIMLATWDAATGVRTVIDHGPFADDGFVTFSGSGARLAFWGRHSGDPSYRLWTANRDGSNVQGVFPNSLYLAGPGMQITANPDYVVVAAYAVDSSTPPNLPGWYVVNILDGSAQKVDETTSDAWEHIAVSPAATVAVVAKGDNHNANSTPTSVRLIGLDGRPDVTLTPPSGFIFPQRAAYPISGDNGDSEQWAPDGSFVMVPLLSTLGDLAFGVAHTASGTVTFWEPSNGVSLGVNVPVVAPDSAHIAALDVNQTSIVVALADGSQALVAYNPPQAANLYRAATGFVVRWGNSGNSLTFVSADGALVVRNIYSSLATPKYQCSIRTLHSTPPSVICDGFTTDTPDGSRLPAVFSVPVDGSGGPLRLTPLLEETRGAEFSTSGVSADGRRVTGVFWTSSSQVYGFSSLLP